MDREASLLSLRGAPRLGLGRGVRSLSEAIFDFQTICHTWRSRSPTASTAAPFMDDRAVAFSSHVEYGRAFCGSLLSRGSSSRALQHHHDGRELKA